ncbi:hypothetical protein PVAP13_3NG275500 [Panicum virgatum]|uniref:Uncharacterized protein n=1 Tax=Panicum virgatum TaxID=38727 RepID=A0A8T0UN65_PANVG|nr:hypothetical protein PVAP13_3NG275500 [Panicum virgatum]
MAGGSIVFLPYFVGDGTRSVFLRPCERVEILCIPGVRPLSALLLWSASRDFASGRRRRCRRRRIALPLPLSACRRPILFQHLRCVLVWSGVGSCGVSMLWSRSWRRKVDSSWPGCSSPAARSFGAMSSDGGAVL